MPARKGQASSLGDKAEFQDQRSALATQFSGMSDDDFAYEDYEQTRVRLVDIVNTGLTSSDKQFLVGFNNGEPDWSIYDFEKYPSVQWKLLNLNSLKTANPQKHRHQLDLLKESSAPSWTRAPQEDGAIELLILYEAF